jgi:signal transduction histidine kinase
VTLTNRLSVFFLLALATVLVAFSVALFALAHRHLHRQLDDRLAASAHTLAAVAEVEPDGVEWETHNKHLSLGAGVFGDQLHWTVTDDQGRVLDRSQHPDTLELIAAAEDGFRSGHRNPRRTDHADRAWQVTQLRLEPDPPAPGPFPPGKYRALVLTVAAPLDPVLETLRLLGATLLVLTLAVLVIALFASRAVCRRALAPVARMAEAARSMGAVDLTHRLPGSTSADELANLSAAFNELLDRLAEAFERERRFAGEASHQLRTPLAAIIGQVEVALRRERTPSDYRHALSAVADQAGRLRRVVEALLFLARSEADARLPGVEAINLATYLPEWLRNRSEAPRGTDLVFEPVESAGSALVHQDLFAELLDALLDNARKYSQPGTPIIVRIGRTPQGPWVEVEDHGCGISAADLPNLFRPFFRSDSTRREVAGAGLGLAVASRIATALGGSLTVESEPGRGSRFRVRLPAGPAGEPDESGSVVAPAGAQNSV